MVKIRKIPKKPPLTGAHVKARLNIDKDALSQNKNTKFLKIFYVFLCLIDCRFSAKFKYKKKTTCSEKLESSSFSSFSPSFFSKITKRNELFFIYLKQLLIIILPVGFFKEKRVDQITCIKHFFHLKHDYGPNF